MHSRISELNSKLAAEIVHCQKIAGILIANHDTEPVIFHTGLPQFQNGSYGMIKTIFEAAQLIVQFWQSFDTDPEHDIFRVFLGDLYDFIREISVGTDFDQLRFLSQYPDKFPDIIPHEWFAAGEIHPAETGR